MPRTISKAKRPRINHDDSASAGSASHKRLKDKNGSAWRERPRGESDDNDETGASRKDSSSHKRFEHITAQDQTRQHVGDHYGDVKIYHGCSTPARASKSPEPDATQSALESLMFDEMDSRYLTIATTFPTTCKWFLGREEYRRWQDKSFISEHHGFLWVKGKAGAGKSTLMKYAFNNAEKSRKDNETVISFFFNARGAPIEKSLEGMYRSLLYQLLEKLPRLRPLLNKRRTLSARRQGWSLTLLKEVIRDAIETLESDRLSCYVDALDECTEDDVKDMVAFFEELGESAVSNGVSFYVCFASRHYPYIDIKRSESIILEDSDGHKDDIAKYIRKKLNINNKKLKQEMTEKIEQRASGVFLWVCLVVNILNTECDSGNAQAIQKRLDEIPTKIKDLIEDILTRGGPTKYLLPLLQWVLFSKRPLNRQELYLALQCVDGNITWDAHSALALSKDNIDKFILNASKGLAEMTKGKKPKVQFIHELVRTHFVDDGGLVALDSELKINMVGRSHDQLKKSCYSYLLSEPCAQVVTTTPLPPMYSTEQKENRRRRIESFPFVLYAWENVLRHADEAQAGGVEQREFLDGFDMVTWMRINNVLARLKSHRVDASTSRAHILASSSCPNLLGIALEVSPELSDKSRYQILSAAVRARDLQSTLFLLKQGPIDSYHRADDGSVLWQAMSTADSNLEIVQALLEADFKPFSSIKSREMHNAIAEAASSPDRLSDSLGRFGLLRLVLRHVSILDQKNESCQHALTTALVEVCSHGDISLSTLLLEKGVKANGGEKGWNSGRPLHRACGSGNEELARLLIKEGADPKHHPINSFSCLEYASSRGHLEVVRLLISEGVEVRANQDALVLASYHGYNDIVRSLLDAGANVNERSRVYGDGDTAVSNACRKDHVSTARLLINNGADLSVRDYAGSSPLFYACYARSEAKVEMLQLLLESGADIDAVNQRGESGLWVASFKGFEKIVQVLIENGADVNICASDGRSPLAAALSNGHHTIAQMLREKGAHG